MLDYGRRSLPLSESAWYEVVQSRPRLVIFPYLEGITGRMKGMNALFMGDSVDHVHLELDRGDSTADRAAVASFVERFRFCMPSVSDLHISRSGRKDLFAGSFGVLVSSLRLLKALTVPPEFLNPYFLNFLPRLTFLEAVTMECDDEGWFYLSDGGRARAADETDLHFPVGSFPALRSISLCLLSSLTVMRIFSHTHFPSWRLASVSLQFLYGWQIPPLDIRAVIRVLADCCHLLEYLSIRFAEWERLLGAVDPEDFSSIQIQDILPIFGIRSLTSLYIDHPCPIVFEEGDVERLARAGHGLRVLWLNPWPRWNVSSILLPLESLALFSQFCPFLLRLGVAVDFLVVNVEVDVLDEFPCLKELLIGDMCPPPSSDDGTRYHQLSSAAVYLSTLLPAYCTLSTIDTVSSGMVSFFDRQWAQWQDERLRDIEGWRVVQGMVNLLLDEKKEHLARLRRLCAEVQAEEELMTLTSVQ